MRKILLAAAVAIAAPSTPLLAQDAEPGSVDDEFGATTGQLADTLRDPETQQRLATMVAVMSEVLLDLPLAPLAEAAAEATGEDPSSIDPDMTLRDMAPGAEDVQEEVAGKLPRMMDAMGGMAGGLEAMLPALRDMAARMEGAMEDAR